MRAPDGGLSSLTPTCGASACTVRFQAPDTGAFAGTYQVTVIDRETGWQRVVEIVVPLSVSADRATLLSLDPLRRSAAVTVTGAGPGATVILSPDAAAQGAGIQADGPASAGDEADSGNPAGFTVTVPDRLVTALPVTLSAASPGLADGTLEMRAEPAIVYQGVILDPLGAPLPDAEVVLLKETRARALAPPLEDENGERYRAMTDGNGDFVLYAPPLNAGAVHWLEAVAPDYVATRREAADCAVSPCVLTLTAAEDVATPRFTPPAGAYPGGVTVTLESTTPGATLRYTLDGTTPSPSHGTEVANGTRLSLETDTTVKVIGYQAGLNVSEVASARYTITAVAVDSGGGAGGLAWWLLAPLLLWRAGGGRRAATLALAMLMLAPPWPAPRACSWARNWARPTAGWTRATSMNGWPGAGRPERRGSATGAAPPAGCTPVTNGAGAGKRSWATRISVSWRWPTTTPARCPPPPWPPLPRSPARAWKPAPATAGP